MKVLVYTKLITSRSQYVFEQVVSEYLGVDMELTTDPNRFSASELPKINYSNSEFPGSLQVVPFGLLEQKGVQPLVPEKIIVDDVAYFFPTGGDMQADIFSACFYLLTRYEEYIVEERDSHGRFMAVSSVMYQHDLLKLPLVDRWMMVLGDKLKAHFPNLKLKQWEFEAEMTFDLDSAFAYLGKGSTINTGGLLRDLLSGRIGLVLRRLRTLSGLRPDPYDTYAYLNKILSKYEYTTRWFIPVGDRARLDKNLPHDSSRYQRLVNRLARTGTVGIHPSYESNSDIKVLSREVKRLQ